MASFIPYCFAISFFDLVPDILFYFLKGLIFQILCLYNEGGKSGFQSEGYLR